MHPSPIPARPLTARDLPRGGHRPGEGSVRFQMRMRADLKQRVMAAAIAERLTQNQQIERLLEEALEARDARNAK